MGVRVVAADVLAAVAPDSHAAALLIDPRVLRGLVRMAARGAGGGSTAAEQAAAARALWALALAEGDGAIRVEEAEGAVATLAGLLSAAAVDVRAAAAGALGAVLGRGLHSSTSQLNLSRCGHASPCPPV